MPVAVEYIDVRINNFRQLTGLSNNVVFRHTINASDGSGVTEYFPELSESADLGIDDLGAIVGTCY